MKARVTRLLISCLLLGCEAEEGDLGAGPAADAAAPPGIDAGARPGVDAGAPLDAGAPRGALDRSAQARIVELAPVEGPEGPPSPLLGVEVRVDVVADPFDGQGFAVRVIERWPGELPAPFPADPDPATPPGWQRFSYWPCAICRPVRLTDELGATRLVLQTLDLQAAGEDTEDFRWNGVGTFLARQLTTAPDGTTTSEMVRGRLEGRPDDVAPQVRAEIPRGREVLLPWEQVLLRFAEPVLDQASLLQVFGPEGELVVDVTRRWGAVTPFPEGLMGLEIESRSLWPQGQLRIPYGEGHIDPSRNPTVGARFSIPRVDQPALVPRLDYEPGQAEGAVVHWGAALPTPGGVCEGDGCLTLRVEPGRPLGTYGRLGQRGSFGRVRASFRLLAAACPRDEGFVTISGRAHPDGEMPLVGQTSGLTLRPVPLALEPDFMCDSGWRTLQVPVSADGQRFPEIGVAFEVNTGAAGPLVGPVLLVDEVELAP